MQNRGTARKRVVPVVGRARCLRPGAPITAGAVEIGTLGSIAGEQGLALVRLDRAAEFSAEGRSVARRRCPRAHRAAELGHFSLAPAPAPAGTPAA